MSYGSSLNPHVSSTLIGSTTGGRYIVMKPEQLDLSMNGLVPSIEALLSMLSLCTFSTPWEAVLVSWPCVHIVLKGALGSGLKYDEVRTAYDLWLTCMVQLPANSDTYTWEMLTL